MSGSLIQMLKAMPCADRRFAAGKHVFRQGDKVRSLHLILDGGVHLVRHQANGASLTLQRAGANSILAEASLFSEEYHCDAIARTSSNGLVFDKAMLRRALTVDGRFADAWAAYLSKEVQSVRARAEILSLRTVSERLDAWMAAGDGAPPARGMWRIVATEIGISPEALYREIAKRGRAS